MNPKRYLNSQPLRKATKDGGGGGPGPSTRPLGRDDMSRAEELTECGQSPVTRGSLLQVLECTD